jgi:hypothetical protein
MGKRSKRLSKNNHLKRSYKKRTRRRQRGGEIDGLLFIQLMGGLGNQLYIYAAGLTVSRKIGLPLCVIPRTENKHKNRDYTIMLKSVPIENTPDNMKRIEMADPIMEKPIYFYSTLPENYDMNGNSKDKKLPFGGCYQNYKSIYLVIPEIKQLLLTNEFNKEQYHTYKIGIDSNTAAFMHVRRGDYIERRMNNPDEYYLTALKELNNNIIIKTIYILSDDIGWCREQESKWKEISNKNIEYKDIKDEVEALYFLTLCMGGAIISSSTFSCWGAYLGPNENSDSTIIYPNINPWDSSNTPNVNEFPSRWIGL